MRLTRRSLFALPLALPMAAALPAVTVTPLAAEDRGYLAGYDPTLGELADALAHYQAATDRMFFDPSWQLAALTDFLADRPLLRTLVEAEG